MRRSLLSAAGSVVVLAAMIGGCDQPNPTGTRTLARQSDVGMLAVADPKFRTIDDEFADVAAQSPGFGGLFYDSDGNVNVYLTNPSRLANVTGPITALLQRRGLPSMRGTKVLQGQYDYRDLLRGYQALQKASGIFARGGGVTLTDIDERRNRIVVGVTDEASRLRVIQALSQTPSISAGSFIVEQRDPVEIRSTLQWYQDPDEGGEKIGSTAGACTNGFNAYRVVGSVVDTAYAHRYFITASHCTGGFGIVSGPTMGQPDSTVPKGNEVDDPPLFTSATSSYCPANRYCRWSDAAVFQYLGYISWNWPYILKVCSGITICGSTEMQVEALSTAVGQNVQTLGQSSGYRSGSVTNTCINVVQYVFGQDSGRTMLCQEEATFLSQGGDSGSPVYRSDGMYRAAGILWGSTSTRSYYSPIGGLQADGLRYSTARQSSLAP